MTSETPLTSEDQLKLRENWHRLSALYGSNSPRLPVVPLTDWRPAALACLARGHYAMQSAFALESRPVDAAVMARVAFEHIVTFGWLMIDPAGNHPRLIKKELIHNEEMLRDLKAQGSKVPLENVNFDELRKMAGAESIPKSHKCAELADAHWSSTLPEHTWSFRRSYANLYRPYSSLVHPILSGLKSFLHDDGTSLLVGQPSSEQIAGDPLAECAALLADALFITSIAFGWPRKEAVAAAFTAGFLEMKNA